MVSNSFSYRVFHPQVSLNPCCNGRWSLTRRARFLVLADLRVLILVVMEDGLRLSRTLAAKVREVLILVVMEDGL